jgi:hypothetical protein
VEQTETGIDPVDAAENPGSISETDTPGDAANFGETDTLAEVTEEESKVEDPPVEDTECNDEEECPAEAEMPKAPEIGMDGKTKDGAMPYDLLMKQLEFLR